MSEASQSQASARATRTPVISPGHSKCFLSLLWPTLPSSEKGFGNREEGGPDLQASAVATIFHFSGTHGSVS